MLFIIAFSAFLVIISLFKYNISNTVESYLLKSMFLHIIILN